MAEYEFITEPAPASMAISKGSSMISCSSRGPRWTGA